MNPLIKTQHEILITNDTITRIALTAALIFALWFLFHYLYKNYIA